MVFNGDFYRTLPQVYIGFVITEGLFLIIGISIQGTKVTYTTSATTPPTEPSDIIAKRDIGANLFLLGFIVPFTVGFCYCGVGCCGKSNLKKEAWKRMFRRIITMNCLCPCYIPRPRLRFIIRFVFHIICILCRIAAIIVFETSRNETSISPVRDSLRALSIISGVFLIFPILTILLDVYHCRVWWPYHPAIYDVPHEIIEKPFSPKHKGFIPYVLTEQFRTTTIGNRKCNKGNNCRKRDLEHMVIFHATDYQPQARWSNEYPVYIGFHRTKPESAYSISKSDCRPSRYGMLGPGAYFVRSTQATRYKIGQQDQIGAWIIAKISMSKVFFVDDYSIRAHLNDPRFDPFDYKISSYKLDAELQPGPCKYC